MDIRILMFEDSTNKVESLEEYLVLRFKHELNCNLTLQHRADESMMETDLMMQQYHLILIDDDLGNDLWGNIVIDTIMSIADTTPEILNVPKIYYSAGTPVNELKEKSAKFGGIRCSTFDDLSETVFNTIQTRYFNNK